MAKCILCKKEEINQQGYCNNHLPRGWFKEIDVVTICSGETRMKWISVKERLPENRSRILICADRAWVGEAWFEYLNDEPGWYRNDECCSRGVFDVTHWQPLPLAIEESE